MKGTTLRCMKSLPSCCSRVADVFLTMHMKVMTLRFFFSDYAYEGDDHQIFFFLTMHMKMMTLRFFFLTMHMKVMTLRFFFSDYAYEGDDPQISEGIAKLFSKQCNISTCQLQPKTDDFPVQGAPVFTKVCVCIYTYTYIHMCVCVCACALVREVTLLHKFMADRYRQSFCTYLYYS